MTRSEKRAWKEEMETRLLTETNERAIKVLTFMVEELKKDLRPTMATYLAECVARDGQIDNRV